MCNKIFKKITLIWPLLAALMLTACSGGGGGGSTVVPSALQQYYVDATSGNDANSGLSTSAAWKTLGKVSASTFQSGTTIYLKRGETWYEQLDIPRSGISVDAYGSGALPVIDGSTDLGNLGWASLGAGVYSKSVTLASGEGLGNVSENGTMLGFVSWNSDCSTSLAAASNGSFAYGYPNLVCLKLGTDPNSNGLPYRASRKFFGISATSKSSISIKNVQVQRFSLNGTNYVDCANCTVSNVVAKQGGGAVILVSLPSSNLYAGNGVECDKSCSNILFENLTVSEIFDSGISPQTYGNNQTASNITIQNSTVDKAGFAGVEVSVLSNGGTTGSSISNVTVSGLTITNSGKGWSGQRYGSEGHGMRIIADTGAGIMSNVLVQDSTVSGSAGDGIKLSGEIGTVTLRRIKAKTNNYGINVSASVATSATLKLVLTTSLIFNNSNYGVHFNAPSAAGFNLYHNTFYNNSTINFAVFNQAGQARLQNNIFYSSGAMAHLYVAATLAGATVNSNCYNNQAGMIGYNSASYATVSSFNAATVFEAGGYGGAGVDMSNPGGEAFTLLSSSACKILGVSGLDVTQDYSLYTYASPPSSGAYQYR